METFSALLAITGALMLSLIYARINGWVNNRKAGDLRHHRAHYDATVMEIPLKNIYHINVLRMIVQPQQNETQQNRAEIPFYLHVS